ncbi:hypothetical protein PAXRUDRAFT_147397 [Paxillus rubicundulus Ve08.2h10]|uniref:CRA domain-containing protein n=1 Tax=Paxillus rubicundulus Ve08.2h10 TaxID=930991 RepID=A0A0D0D6H6_9AGAM|nr:hypothetical protein PAXRUDRAFT_147397 [Paxillus rubicundulus Ve08.2h10]
MVVLTGNFSELLGYTSICCWLGAQFPQILENIRQQSCESLAWPFLLNWMLGDASNLIGCLLTHQLPFQTYLATYFCMVDCCIISQYIYYGGGPKTAPIAYARPRSRTTSSVGGLSIDASHYRTLSAAAGSIAAAAALAAYPEAHTEHRYARKRGEEHPIDDHVSIPRVPDDEVNDAVVSALSDSFHSDNGRRKRVSWSQERHERQPRPRMSPVIPSLHSAAAAAALARGRPLQREGEAEEFSEEQEQTERRAGSRASRRGAGMLLLGVWALFGIGRYAGGGTRPSVGSEGGIGSVLVPNANLDLVKAGGLPVAYDPSIHLPNLHPSSVDVRMSPLPGNAVFDEQGQPNEKQSYERVLGRIFAWLCTTLYLTSRLPQIWKNYVRKSVEGLSMYLFVFAFLGNFFYVLSILTSPKGHLPPPESTEFFRESIPYLLGSGGTFFFDITIVTQSFIYKGRHPRRSHVRSRGGSLVRSAAVAEETAGLLRGDALAESRAYSQRGRHTSDSVSNQNLSEPRPDHLRKLVLDYLCHNCYVRTAQAFAKDSVVRHFEDVNEIRYGTTSSSRVEDELNVGQRPWLTAFILLQGIRIHILSGKVEGAIALLNEHFPKVLAEDEACETIDADVEMETSDDKANPGQLGYTTNTVNPIHLSLNLRILAFIEACRTVPLVYDASHRRAGSPMSMDLDSTTAPPSKCHPRDEDKYQMELLIRAQKLYATVNALRNQEERALYIKELSNVGGLLAYKIPEDSPVAKYLHQERRDRVAEQINSAILYRTNMPTVSYLELAVRYTHFSWAALHELRVKVPASSHPPSGVALPPRAKTQSASGPSCEVSRFRVLPPNPRLNFLRLHHSTFNFSLIPRRDLISFYSTGIRVSVHSVFYYSDTPRTLDISIIK